MIVEAVDRAIRPGSGVPRVAILATHGGHAGGAAIAMERLAAGMRLCGATVDVVTRDAICPARLPAERRARRAVRRSRTGESNTMFTCDWPAWDVASHPAVAAADLVNVHWVAGFLGGESIRRLAAAGKAVIWTLHDMRPFTGGCHYAAGCTGFTDGCGSCPQIALARREVPRRAAAVATRRLRGVPLVFAAPSRWLAGELMRSRLHDATAHSVEVIPNGIDLVRHAPTVARAAVRRRLGLPEDGFGILLGSVSLDERRKGAREAVAALAAMRSEGPAVGAPFVVTYGGAPPEITGIPVRHLGSRDEAGVIEALHACDVHLTMTREDNLPNTVMEAMACGVPVIGTSVGGLPEMVTDGIDGWLVGRDDVAAAGAVLARLAGAPAEVAAAAAAARARAVADWDQRRVAARYLGFAAGPPGRFSGMQAGEPCLLPPSPAAARLLGRAAFVRRPVRGLRRLGVLRPRGFGQAWWPSGKPRP